MGDPINPLNGNFYERDVDYSLPGRGLDVRFERVYGSLESGALGYPDSMLWRIPLGLGWTHAYNLYLDPTWLDTTRTLQFITRWDTVMYHDEQGNERLYMKTSNALSPAGDTLYKGEKGDRNLLGRKAGRFTLYREDGSRILFNNKGRADTIYDRNSNRITLAYSANDTGDLIKITDTRNRSIYLSYYPGTHRLRRIYEAPDSTNGRYYEYRYGVRRVTAVDTLTPPKSRYQLQQVLRHFPTGGEDSLIVLNRYYYDRDHRMITKVFPTGGHGSENDTSYAVNRKRGDRVSIWYRDGRAYFQEVVNGDGDTLVSNDNVISKIYIACSYMGHWGFPDSVSVYYSEGSQLVGAHDPDTTALGDTTWQKPASDYYRKTYFFDPSYYGYARSLTKVVTRASDNTPSDSTLYVNYDHDFKAHKIKGPMGDSTLYTYQTYTDRTGYIRYLAPTKIKYPNGDSVRTHYIRPDSVKMPLFWVPDTTWNEDTLKTIAYYDAYGNDTMVTAKSRVLSDSISLSAQDVVTKFKYTKGNRVRVLDPKGNKTYFNYGTGDSSAYVTRTWIDMDNDSSVSNPDIVNQYWYNANRGLLDSMGYYQDFTTSATPTKVRYKYDPLNHLKTVTYPDSAVDSLIYDKRGNVLEKWMAKSGTNYWHATYSYDAMDHLTQVDEQTNNLGTLGPPTTYYTTRYFYNLDGNMNEFRSAHSGMSVYSTYYDYSMGRLIRVRYSDGTNDSLGYYADGSLMYKRSRKSQVTKYVYDDNCSPCGRGRLTRKRYFASADTSIAATDSVRYSYDKVGDLTKVVWKGPSALDSTLYAYDQLYRLKQDSAVGFNRVIRYQYDLNGNRQRMKVVNPNAGADSVKLYISYRYWDRANRDSTIAVKVGSNSYTWRMLYYDTGPLKRIIYPSTTTALKEGYTLTPRNFVSVVADTFGASTVKYRNIYTYNQVGDRSADSLLLTKPNASTIQGKIRWNYDNIRRLTATRYPASIASGDSAVYSYDNMGNRTSKVSGGGTTSYSYNLNNNELTSDGNSYSYDANGNLIQKSTVIEDMFDYVHDFENRLTKVKQMTTSDSVRFEYDGVGQRTRKVGLTDTTRYTWDGLYPVVEWNNQGKLKQTFIYANGLLLGLIDSTLYTNRRFFVLHDGLGSSICMTNDSARIVRSFIYSDFGERLVDETAANTPALNRLYAGYPWDGSPANFHWMLFRHTYEPSIGRFAQEDLLGDQSGWNRYIYAGNSPLGHIDRLGLMAGEVCTNITMKRHTLHWWVELGENESYGWFPKKKNPTRWEMIYGVEGELNGVTNHGGSPTRDPYHGFPAEDSFNPTITPSDKCQCMTCLEVESCIRNFARSYKGKWAIWRSCQTFQKEMMKSCCLDEPR